MNSSNNDRGIDGQAGPQRLVGSVTRGLCFLAAAGLRTPLAVPGPYPAPFGMVPHAGMNGELTSPGAAYAGLHNISPQMSAAAAAAVVAYGRSPMVGAPQQQVLHHGRHWGGLGRRAPRKQRPRVPSRAPPSSTGCFTESGPSALCFTVLVDEKRQCLGATSVVRGHLVFSHQS